MRFLVISQYFPPEVGAPQIRLNAVTKELKNCNHDVEVITTLPSYPHGRTFDKYKNTFHVLEDVGGIPVHRIWSYPAKGRGMGRMLNYATFALMSHSFLFSVSRPDFILVESPPLWLWITGWIYRLRHPRSRVILNVADLWPDDVRGLGLVQNSLLLRLLYWLESWAYREAAFVSYVPPQYGDVLRSRKGVPREKLLFLPNGIDPQQERGVLPSTLREVFGRGRCVFTIIGTHGYVHGMDVAIRAAKLIDGDSALVLCVGDGSDKPRLCALAQELGCQNVVFHEAVPPEVVPGIYDGAFASISSVRGLACTSNTRPARTLAAMAAARPVLYSGKGEGADMVIQAGAGIVTPPDDPVALAQAMRWLMDHPQEAAEMGQRGRSYVEQHLSWKRIVNDWLRQLEERDSLE